MAKPSKEAAYGAKLLAKLGCKPTTSFPAFEATMGWPLPPAVVPFAGPFATDRTPPVGGWYYLEDKHGPKKDGASPPWSYFAKLAKSPEKALAHFLVDLRVYGLLFGLVGFAEDPGGDVAFVDVGPGGASGEVFEHNHEVGALWEKRVTLAGFVREGYASHAEDEEDADPSDDEVDALGAPPKPDRARVKEVLALYQAGRWMVPILRGDFDQPPVPGKPPKGTGPLVVHHELCASALTGDEARARKALAAAKKWKGALTRGLAARVEANLADPRGAKLGWLKAAQLAELRAAWAAKK